MSFGKWILVFCIVMKTTFKIFAFLKALQQQQRKAVEKQQEEEDNLAEIYNVLTSDMLTENPDVANSCLGPGKKVAYLYRGMTPEELEQFRREQKIQAEEKAVGISLQSII